MTPQLRRILIIAAAAIVVIGLGVGSYFIFSGDKNQTGDTPKDGNADFPDAGGTDTGGTGPTGTTTITVPNTPVKVTARLMKVTVGPVVPGVIVTDTVATTTAGTTTTKYTRSQIFYIERQSGNVFSYDVSSGTPTRTSNKTVPGIQLAKWLPGASTAYVTYLSDENFSTVSTYALSASGADGFYLPQNLSDIAVSSTSLLMLASGVNGSSATLSKLDGTGGKQVFSSALSALRISFAGKNRYFAFTKPAAALDGAAFLIDGTGMFSRIAGPAKGLVGLISPSGTRVLVSSIDGNGMHLSLIDTVTGKSSELPIQTIADKCVWTADSSAVYCGIPYRPPKGTYPDDWYQGVVHFSDRIWKIDAVGSYTQLVLDFSSETKGDLDAISLAINPSSTILSFVNKNDGSLWSYAL